VTSTLHAEQTPFSFFTVAYLTRIGNQCARNLTEFLKGLQECSDTSIFYHTFQTLESHHFLTEGFSNDFAQWVLASANRDELAEQLAALDIRDYLSIAELRSDLCRVVSGYCLKYPNYANQEALEPFYFCESVEVTEPVGLTVNSLRAFREAIERIAHASFYFHFISSRLRLHLRTNDFSVWLENSLGLETLANTVNRIDVYTNTLDGARASLVRLIELEEKKG